MPTCNINGQTLTSNVKRQCQTLMLGMDLTSNVMGNAYVTGQDQLLVLGMDLTSDVTGQHQPLLQCNTHL